MHYTVIVTLGMLLILLLILSRKIVCYETLYGAFLFAAVFFLNNNSAMKEYHIVSNNAYNLIQIDPAPKDDAIIFNMNHSKSSRIGVGAHPERKVWEYISYVQHIFIDPVSGANHPPLDILVIGAGGFTLGLDDKVNHYTFVDIDKSLKQVAETYFLPEKLSANKRFIAASARAFVHNHHEQYDLVYIDAYTNIMSIPMETTTREFLMDVKKLARPNGVVLANIIGSPTMQDKFTVRYSNTFASVFPTYSRQIIQSFDPWLNEATQKDPKRQNAVVNFIFMYFNNALAGDTGIYTDDKNTYSLDRNRR